MKADLKKGKHKTMFHIIPSFQIIICIDMVIFYFDIWDWWVEYSIYKDPNRFNQTKK